MSAPVELPVPLEAERAILGALLVYGDDAWPELDGLEPRHFGRAQHGRLFAACSARAAAGLPHDSVAWLDAPAEHAALGGMAWLLEVGDSAPPAAASLPHYRRLVMEAHDRRTIYLRLGELRAQALTGDLGAVLAGAADLAAGSEPEGWVQLGHVADEEARAVEERCAAVQRGEVPETCVAWWGLPTLDDMAPLVAGEVVIVAARPAMGKSALALQAAVATAERGVPVALVSLEMGARQLAQRRLSLGGVSTRGMRRGDLQPHQLGALEANADSLYALPVWVMDRPLSTADAVLASLRTMIRRRGCRMVIVDYLQLLSTPGRDRRAELEETSRRLKGLALTEGVCVMLVSQLSRACDARSDARPLLSDLRETGQLEQDADVVLMVYRDDVYTRERTGRAELILRKNRPGELGTLHCRWLGEQTRFTEER